MFRNQRFSVLSFLLIFAGLYYSFVAYIGIVSPGGTGYSPFLDHYFNVPAWLTYSICTAAKTLLQVGGYNVYQKAPNNVSIHGSGGVNIIWACLGFGVMSVWAAFVTAHKAGWRYKVKWIITGIVLIVILNIIRIASIPLAFHYHWKTYSELDVHSSFNIVSYFIVFGLMFWFANKYKQYKKGGNDYKKLPEEKYTV